MLQRLERCALIGLALGLGSLVVDALRHPGFRFFRIPVATRTAHHGVVVHHGWGLLVAAVRGRPALTIGAVLLCAALVMALAAAVVELVQLLTTRREADTPIAPHTQ